MSNKKKQDLPFIHSEFNTTVTLLNLARELFEKSKKKNADLSNIFASTMLYVSIDEYMAKFLLNSMRELVKNSTFVSFNGIMYINETKKNEKLTLGQLVTELKKYTFPDCQEIIRLFDEIAKARNIVFHNLSKPHQAELKKIDDCMQKIPGLSEELINKIDVIGEGFRKMIYPQQQANGEQQDGTA